MNTSLKQRTVLAYTDGACKGNPGKGGWAFTLQVSEHVSRREYFGYSPNTTNNQMELQAVIEVFNQYKPNPQKFAEVLIIHSDSNYVVNGVNQYLPNWKENGWRKPDRKSIANLEQWKALDGLLENLRQQGVTVQIVKVAAHADVEGNNLVDILASEAATLTPQQIQSRMLGLITSASELNQQLQVVTDVMEGKKLNFAIQDLYHKRAQYEALLKQKEGVSE